MDRDDDPSSGFASGFDHWAQPRLTAREVTMLRAMNDVTDTAGWASTLDDAEALARIRPSPLVTPLLSDAAWAWCVAELRDKAEQLAQRGYVHVFDSGLSVVKSDSLITPELLAHAQIDIKALVAEASSAQRLACSSPGLETETPVEPGWERLAPQPQILRLVDPSLFPLVRGRTRVVSGDEDGANISLEAAVESIGLGEIDQSYHQPETGKSAAQLLDDIFFNETPFSTSYDAEPYRRSDRFQWLPCEVEFIRSRPGIPVSAPPEVRITSYINNLHPIRYKALYRLIEQVLCRSIRPWEEVLVKGSQFRKPPRVRTFGVSWMPPLPDWVYDLESLDNEKQKIDGRQQQSLAGTATDVSVHRSSLEDDHRQFEREYQAAEQKVEGFLSLPDPIFRQPGLPKVVHARLEHLKGSLRAAVDGKYESIKTHWLHPEPGTSFTYEEWKAQKNVDRGVVPPRNRVWRNEKNGPAPTSRQGSLSAWNSQQKQQKPQQDSDSISVSLQRDFGDKGLQVVVRMTSIELTPERPMFDTIKTDIRSARAIVRSQVQCMRCDFHEINREYTEGSGDWYIDGMLNEHIVATTLVCLSSENVSPYSLLLQVEADLDPLKHHYTPGQFEELAATYEVWPLCALGGDYSGGKALQVLGRVTLPPGRMVVMPAPLRRQLAQPVELLDGARGGHVRLLEIHLIDPSRARLCSTRNVPPQQHHWWADAAGIERIRWATQFGLPQEIVDKIAGEVGDDWPMGLAEAEKLRGVRMTEELLARHAVDAGVETYDFSWE